MERFEAKVAVVQKKIDTLQMTIRDRLFSGKEGKGTRLPAKVVAAFRSEAVKRTSEQKELVKEFTESLELEITAATTSAEKTRRAEKEREIAVIQTTRPREIPRAYIWLEDSPQAPVTHVMRRGDPTKPLDAVSPGLPAVLARE